VAKPKYPSELRRTKCISLYLSPLEHERFFEAAWLRHQRLPEFLRAAAEMLAAQVEEEGIK